MLRSGILLGMLVLGGALAATAAFVAGASGFGLGLVAIPLLLLSGFSLPFVVTVNLLISLAMRVSVMWRMRKWITWRRPAALIGGAVPGLWVGSAALGAVDPRGVRVAAAFFWMEPASRSGRPVPRYVPLVVARRPVKGVARPRGVGLTG